MIIESTKNVIVYQKKQLEFASVETTVICEIAKLTDVDMPDTLIVHNVYKGESPHYVIEFNNGIFIEFLEKEVALTYFKALCKHDINNLDMKSLHPELFI